MAVIRINDLKVRALIGAYSWERVNKQDLVFNVTIEYDSSRACRSDKLKSALDYESVAAKIIKIAKSSRYVLLEKLASKVLAGIVSDKRVKAATIRIDKLHALPNARCVSCELSEKKGTH